MMSAPASITARQKVRESPRSSPKKVSVPFGTFTHGALTLEWTRLEPGGIDRKYYVRGIGVVKEVAAQGPKETANLVRFTHP